MEVGSSSHRATSISDEASKRNKTPDTAQDACVICLQPISERAVAVPCNHYTFDFLCLASWLNERPKCPLCNIDVSEIQYDWRGPDDFKSYRVPPPDGKGASASSTAGLSHRFSGRGGSRISSIRRARRSHHRQRATVVPTKDEAIARRRHVYRRQQYSLHVGSNRVSRYRNITPQVFAGDAELQSRARKWIRRELLVFDYLNPTAASSGGRRQASNAEFLLEYIVAILKTVDVKGAGGQAEDMLAEFLGRADARLFLHELSAWLRSPFVSLHDWDRNVQYAEALPSAASTHGATDSKRSKNRNGGERTFSRVGDDHDHRGSV